MRFGLVLADMNSGSSLRLVPFVTSMFKDRGKDSLIIFPGGRLENAYPEDRSRNFIYNYANPSNLDGSIIWSSSLTGDADSEQVMMRFRNLTKLPLVTISGKTTAFPDIPDVNFDAEEGTAELVRHCIEKHGASRFAYIRGPENHRSSNQRFNAFCNTLQACGLSQDWRLYSDPGPWSAGDRGMRQLLDERKLVPGKDFDALFCASDLILYRAATELQKRGYSIPEDVIACGFNDSAESRLLPVPVTTVRMPYAEMGRRVVAMLDNIVRRQEVGDLILPAYPVIRKSCGCTSEKHEQIKDMSELTDFVSQTFAIPWKDANSILEKVANNPSEKNMREFLDFFCGYSSELSEFINVIKGFPGEKGRIIAEFCNRKLPEALDRALFRRSYDERQIYNNLIDMEKKLLMADSIEEISDILDDFAPSFGFERIELHVRTSEDFIMEKAAPGVWIAAPLCTDSDAMGYMLMKADSLNGYVAEEIRSSVSAAVKGVLLVDEANRARKRAEKAEQAGITFFANVRENLRKPLSEISGLISGSDLEEGTKTSVLDKISGAEETLDLVMGTIGEIDLNRNLMSPQAILKEYGSYEGPEVLPCLLIDEYWFRRAFSILMSDLNGGAVHVSVNRAGVTFALAGKAGKTAENSNSDVILAREIILLHEGTYNGNAGGFTFTLPYPTISGSAASKWNDGPAVCLGESPSSDVGDLRFEETDLEKIILTKRLPAGAGAVLWNNRRGNYDVVSALLAVLGNPLYADLPFICYYVPRTKTIEEAVRTVVRHGGRIVLQVGNTAGSFLRKLPGAEVVSCSLSAVPSVLAEKKPALVVASGKDFFTIMKNSETMPHAPVLIVADSVDDDYIARLGDTPNIIIACSCILESGEFAARIDSVLRGAEILPVMTGSIVKKAQAFICANAADAISRWQIAEAVNVSEDYLTRIFKKEMGISPWDYLNRYRIDIASSLLSETGRSISDIASAAGFKDQAYFCRVFRKVKGINPGKIRSAGRRQ